MNDDDLNEVLKDFFVWLVKNRFAYEGLNNKKVVDTYAMYKEVK